MFSQTVGCFTCPPLVVHSLSCLAGTTMFVSHFSSRYRSSPLSQYIADKILNINENGTYSNPPSVNAIDRKKQDDEIFQRARLVNCGYFMHIILGGTRMKISSRTSADSLSRLCWCYSWPRARRKLLAPRPPYGIFPTPYSSPSILTRLTPERS